MTSAGATGLRSRNVVLAAMIFAVAMTFIDQTIVSIAAPNIQRELGLTNTGVQWAINAYLLALAALFAFGGRLADTVGHRRMVTIGVIVFAGASAMCGLTPKGAAAQTWIVAFRALQGAGGAIMFPAALGIVVQTFPLHQRGRALALFFGIAGGLTAVGPVLGGYLTEWTWRAIFWVNIPVALIALALIMVSRPVTEYRWAPIDYRGLVLIVGGVSLSIVGFQQSAPWGWGNPWTVVCIVVGVALLVAFALVELRTASPLMQVRIFQVRAFAVENLVLGISMLVFVPLFFFASEYAQIALGKSAQQAGLYLLYFFLGFVVTSQIGGRILDRRGAKRPVVIGCALAAGWLCPLGQPADPTGLRQPGVAGDPGRGGDGLHADARQHRRRQPGLPPVLRRGDRHHPDGQELLGQPGLCRARHHIGHPVAVPGHVIARGPGREPVPCIRRGGEARAGAGIRWKHGEHPSFHPRRLRLRLPPHLLHHGRHHGGGVRGRPRGSRTGSPGIGGGGGRPAGDRG